MFSKGCLFPYERGSLMSDSKKAKKELNAKERAASATSRALTTSKPYITTIGFLYHCRMFLLWLLNHENEAAMKRAIVHTDTGPAIRPGKGSMLPASFLATCVLNGSKRCETVKLFNAANECVLRFAFASPTFKYQGWNAGEKQVKAMAATLGLPEASLMTVQQGKKAYYWNTDFEPLHDFCVKHFSKETNKA